jgi:cell division protein FtsN
LANFDRGVYEPSDEAHEGIRVYDGSEEEEDVEGSRLPLLIVLALLVLAMFGGVVWLAYTQGVARGRGETPVLAAAGGPERVAPQDPGGGNVPYQGFKIYEQPAPPDDSAEPVAPAPQAQVPAPPKPAAQSPAAQTPAVQAPAAKGMPPAKTVAALIQQANSDPVKPAMAAAAAAKAAAPKPAAVAPPAPAAGPATGAPRQLGAPVPAVAAAKPTAPGAAAAKPAAPAAAGGYMLQIGAFKSQADADTAWKAFRSRHAALLSGYSDNIQQVDLGEKGTWYRLRVGGFADREVASALCDRLKADGGACILGR